MTEQLFQIAVKGIVRNKEGDVLLLHIQQQRTGEYYWDLPGGRVAPGETFVEALNRELKEEIGTPCVGEPRQIASVLTHITIPIGETRYPLVLTLYEAALSDDTTISIDEDSPEQAYAWFSPAEAIVKMGTVKFPPEFADYIMSTNKQAQ